MNIKKDHIFMKTKKISELINKFKSKTNELIITEIDNNMFIGEYLIYNKILLCNKSYKIFFNQLIIDKKMKNIIVPDNDKYGLYWHSENDFKIILKLKRKEKIVMKNNFPVKIYIDKF